MLQQLDLNCDLGEGCAFDSELLTLISSANVACGGHAGEPHGIAQTLRLAAQNGVVVGAHPGFIDREHFGRRELPRSHDEIFHDCVYQIGALAALAQTVGVKLAYVKPHGALYNMACRDEQYARPVLAAAEVFGLPIMALPRSRLQQVCGGRCRFVAEGFADRRYQPDGSLVPRSQPNAFVHDVNEALLQVDRLVRDFGVETICVHGDNPQAVVFVRALRTSLTQQGVAIRAFV